MSSGFEACDMSFAPSGWVNLAFTLQAAGSSLAPIGNKQKMLLSKQFLVLMTDFTLVPEAEVLTLLNPLYSKETRD